MKFKLYNSTGDSSQEKEIGDFPTLEGDKGIPALRQVMLAHQANARQGNASTKTRAEVSGTGKKHIRQKGTGRARRGRARRGMARRGRARRRRRGRARRGRARRGRALQQEEEIYL